MPLYWAPLCHSIRHKLCGRVLRLLPSISSSLFKVCPTTISQHKLYSVTTFADTRQFPDRYTIPGALHTQTADGCPLQLHFYVTLCPQDTTHRPKPCQQKTDRPHKEPCWCAFIGHINGSLGESNLPLFNTSFKICTL